MTCRAAGLLAEAASDDLPALSRIEQVCLEPAWPPEEMRAELARADATIVVWRAASDAAATGFIIYRDVPGEFDLLQVAVDPAARRAGIATALVQHLLDDARANKKVRVTLEVHADNHAARALYARFGFAAIGRRADYYCDGGDALVLAKELD